MSAHDPDTGHAYMGGKDALEHLLVATFQERVHPWMAACFGEAISSDRVERNHRFLEEALELVQACGCTRAEALQLVDYVYGRPVGEPHQEVGGVQVTLAALCLANKLDMHEAGEIELTRIWGKIEQIRAKQAAKPKNSPLPQVTAAPKQPLVERVALAIKLAMKNGKSTDGFSCDHSGYFMDSWFEKAGQAALDACIAEEMEALLRKLVECDSGFLADQPDGRQSESLKAGLIDADALLAKLDGKL